MNAVLLSPKDLAARWQCSERHVYRLVHERRIEFVKIGRLVRFTPEYVAAFESAGTVAVAS